MAVTEYEMREEPCTEPDGNERYEPIDNRYKHDLMIEATGQCPWCGRQPQIGRYKRRRQNKPK